MFLPTERPPHCAGPAGGQTRQSDGAGPHLRGGGGERPHADPRDGSGGW